MSPDVLEELNNAYVCAESDLINHIDSDFVVMGVLLILLGRIEKILATNGIKHNPD